MPLSKSTSVRVGCLALAAAALLATWIARCPAADEKTTPKPAAKAAFKPNINDLVNETQKMSPKPDELRLIWWIPFEFWKLSAETDPNVTAKEFAEIEKALRPYIMVGVVDAKLGAFGGATFAPELEIRSSLRVIDRDGTAYRPLPDEKVGNDAKNLVAVIKPIITNLVGPMGKNMHFYFFPARNAAGRQIGDARAEGAFTIRLGEDTYRWRLPLGSLLPPKVCSMCAESLNGAFKYCPWCGTKLPAGSAAPAPARAGATARP